MQMTHPLEPQLNTMPNGEEFVACSRCGQPASQHPQQ